ncbi:hypothetical protein IFO70_36890 [Phormidium tenue FACHB-886]|nr:hypothetical protein [Phormidium tenue FACHB-886]
MISTKILSVFQSRLAQLLLIGCALASTSEFAAAGSSRTVNFSGTWEGTATTGSQVFSYRWVINQQGEAVVGTITLSNGQNASSATYTMNGTVEGSRLSFQGEKFLAQSPSSIRCIAAGSLSYIATEDDTPTLSGEWHENDVPQGCPAGTSGEIVLKNPEHRRFLQQ